MPRPMSDSPLEDTDRKGHLLPTKYSSVQAAYDAVGRIGMKQMGVPTGKEIMYGTAILVSKSYVLTNNHVSIYLPTNRESQKIGIEFGAEKNSDYSDFVLLSDKPAIPIAGFDAVLLTLKEPCNSRQPVTIKSQGVNKLKNKEVMAIGYPETYNKNRPRLILKTKRYATGRIISHSKDDDNVLTVPVGAHPSVGEGVTMEVLCHTCSTLKGNSGSAVVDTQTGELIALHFGWDDSYRDGEPVNFAIPGLYLADAIKRVVGSS